MGNLVINNAIINQILKSINLEFSSDLLHFIIFIGRRISLELKDERSVETISWVP